MAGRAVGYCVLFCGALFHAETAVLKGLMKSKTLACTVQIARAMGGKADKMPMHITITDVISGCRVCEIYMPLGEFALAITSSQGKGEMEFWPKAPIGMKAQSKEEIVPFKPVTHKRNEQEVKAALSPFEIDGWRASESDLFNHYRVAGAGKQRVTFFRHVDPETDEPVL
jgi:hypothetical protein